MISSKTYRGPMKTVSVAFNTSYAGNAFAQNTNYFAPFSTTQGAALSSTRDMPASPLTGFVVGISVCMRLNGVVTTGRSVLRMLIGHQKGLHSNSSAIRFPMVSDRFTLSETGGKLYECRIPIKKGETFGPFFRTGPFGASVTNASLEMVVFIEGESGTKEISSGGMETTCLPSRWTAGGVALNDNSFRQIPPFNWGSAPAENLIVLNLVHQSRLTGRIKGIMIGAITSTVGVTQEPIEIEFWTFETIGAISKFSRRIKVGVFNFNPNTGQGNGYLEVNIPIKRGQPFCFGIVAPTMATNPATWQVSIVAYIEGYSDKQKKGIVYNDYGFNNADYAQTANANNNFADSTVYYAPLPFESQTVWGTSPLGFHCSMYDGNVVEMTLAFNLIGTMSSGESVEYGVAMVNADNSLSHYKIGTTQFRQINPANQASPTILQPCEIPIRKGQRFVPYIKTPAWVTDPTNVRLHSIVHIRGN